MNFNNWNHPQTPRTRRRCQEANLHSSLKAVTTSTLTLKASPQSKAKRIGAVFALALVSSVVGLSAITPPSEAGVASAIMKAGMKALSKGGKEAVEGTVKGVARSSDNIFNNSAGRAVGRSVLRQRSSDSNE